MNKKAHVQGWVMTRRILSNSAALFAIAGLHGCNYYWNGKQYWNPVHQLTDQTLGRINTTSFMPKKEQYDDRLLFLGNIKEDDVIAQGPLFVSMSSLKSAGEGRKRGSLVVNLVEGGPDGDVSHLITATSDCAEKALTIIAIAAYTREFGRGAALRQTEMSLAVEKPTKPLAEARDMICGTRRPSTPWMCHRLDSIIWCR